MEKLIENGPTKEPKPERTRPSICRQPCRWRIQWNKQRKCKYFVIS